MKQYRIRRLFQPSAFLPFHRRPRLAHSQVFVASVLSAFLVPTSRKGIPILNKSFLTAVTSLWPSLSVPLLHVSTFSLLSTSRILGARSCMAQLWARHIASLSILTCFVYVFSTHYRKFCCFLAKRFFPHFMIAKLSHFISSYVSIPNYIILRNLFILKNYKNLFE